jgi:hypothetical protein
LNLPLDCWGLNLFLMHWYISQTITSKSQPSSHWIRGVNHKHPPQRPIRFDMGEVRCSIRECAHWSNWRAWLPGTELDTEQRVLVAEPPVHHLNGLEPSCCLAFVQTRTTQRLQFLAAGREPVLAAPRAVLARWPGLHLFVQPASLPQLHWTDLSSSSPFTVWAQRLVFLVRLVLI